MGCKAPKETDKEKKTKKEEPKPLKNKDCRTIHFESVCILLLLDKPRETIQQNNK